MASNLSGQISDKELTDLYNSLEKGSLVKLLIEKHRQLEKKVKNLALSDKYKMRSLEKHETSSKKQN